MTAREQPGASARVGVGDSKPIIPDLALVALVARADWATSGTIVTSWLVTKALSAWVRSEAAAMRIIA